MSAEIETVSGLEISAYAQLQHPRTGEWLEIENTEWEHKNQPVQSTKVKITFESGSTLELDGNQQVQVRGRIKPRIR